MIPKFAMMVVPTVLCLGATDSLLADFIPPHLKVPRVETVETSDMHKEQFDQIIDRIETLYDETIHDLGGELQIHRLWHSPAANASSSQNRGQWMISLYGGLARHPLMTADGFALVACHEIGHHVAGFPQMSSWAASEGNADYFATHSCLKRLWQDDPEVLADDEHLGSLPRELCQQAVGVSEVSQLKLCYREMAAAVSVGRFLASLENIQIDWQTPNTDKVSKTILGYPQPQCRFDTYVAGSLCSRKFVHDVIPWNEKEMATKSCHGVHEDGLGLRPRCWFSPHLGSVGAGFSTLVP